MTGAGYQITHSGIQRWNGGRSAVSFPRTDASHQGRARLGKNRSSALMRAWLAGGPQPQVAAILASRLPERNY